MGKFLQELLQKADLYEQLKKDFTYHSSAIEGSTITLDDNTKINHAAYDKTSKTIEDQLLVYKYDEVFETVIRELFLINLFHQFINLLHEKCYVNDIKY